MHYRNVKETQSQQNKRKTQLCASLTLRMFTDDDPMQPGPLNILTARSSSMNTLKRPSVAQVTVVYSVKCSR
nr:MAG TPA: hypothetical protein [Caudoviricetes sp.]